MARKPEKKKPKRPIGGMIAGVVAALMAGGVYWMSQNIAGVSRGPDQVPNVNLLPPPPPQPPPPPPPPEKQPPPDKQIEPPKQDTPKAADQPRQLTISGPAQAGGDAFGIKAGNGGGMSIGGAPTASGPATGGGNSFAEANYRQYVREDLQRAVESDGQLSARVFNAGIGIWIDPDGRLRRAKVTRSSGDPQIDKRLFTLFQTMRPLSEPPPPNMRFPQEISVKSRRT